MRLKQLYQTKIIPKLMKEFGLKNPYAAPKVSKVVLNMGVGKAIDDKGELAKAIEDLTAIAGQKAVATCAKKSISAFKVRAGGEIGCKVTLRGKWMYEFLDKLFNIVLPRMRDFQGFDLKSFDGSGNFTIGLSEQTAFPEIDAAKVDKLRGLEIVVVTTARDDKKGEALLRALGCPLQEASS